MISIIDVKDFIELDRETICAVQKALGLPAEETVALARQLLATEAGLVVLHHMFRDQITDACANCQLHRAEEERQAYAHFARKYPLPHIL